MKQVVSAIAVAAIISLAVCGASKAAPIAPIPGAATINSDNIIRAYYYHHHYYPYHHRYYGHRYYHHRYY